MSEPMTPDPASGRKSAAPKAKPAAAGATPPVDTPEPSDDDDSAPTPAPTTPQS